MSHFPIPLCSPSVIHSVNIKTSQPLFLRPNLLPVNIRPLCTVPLPCNSFLPDPPRHEVNIYPTATAPTSEVNSTSRTRRELEQLGNSTEDFSTLFFKLAAQKNGIKIEEVQNKAGIVKKDKSLEDFKKLAQRNGITVCSSGSKTQPLAESTEIQSIGRTVGEGEVHPLDSDPGRNNENIEECASGVGKNVVESVGDSLEIGNKSDGSLQHSHFKEELEQNGEEDDDRVSGQETSDFGSCHDCTKHSGSVNTLEHEARDKNCSISEETLSLAQVASHVTSRGIEETKIDQTSNPEISAAVNVQETGEVVLTLDKNESSSEFLAVANDDDMMGKTTVELSEGGIQQSVQDAEILKFREIAESRGIKLGEAEGETWSVYQENTREHCGNTAKDEEAKARTDFTNSTQNRPNNGLSMEEDDQIARFHQIAQLKGIKIGDKAAEASVNKMDKTEDKKANALSLEDDSQVAKFYEIARLKGIKVGKTTGSSVLDSQQKISQLIVDAQMPLAEDEQIARFDAIAQFKDIKVGERMERGAVVRQEEVDDQQDNACSVEYDPHMSMFHQIAQLNGIRVGETIGNSSLELQCDFQGAHFQEITQQNGIKRGGNVAKTFMLFQGNPDVMSPGTEHAQIVRFDEFPQLSGIKEGTKPGVDALRVSMFGNTFEQASQSNDRELELSHQSRSSMEAIFELNARRNGIKIGMAVADNAIPREDHTMEANSLANLQRPNQTTRVDLATESEILSQIAHAPLEIKQMGHFNPGSCQNLGNASLMPSAPGVCNASTQTDVMVLDCSIQTDINEKVNCAAQVDAVKEAFEEEFNQWKLDDDAKGDEVEQSYRELYFEEKRAREDLHANLENEKDVSANAKHNHKRVMEELKEELGSKTSEIERLRKELKTLKKHQETEKKRLSKELKSKDEDFVATKNMLQLKEVALENLRTVMKEQTSQLTTLGERVQDLETSLSTARNNAECKVCAGGCSTSEKDSRNPEKTNQTGDEWTIFTSKKSRTSSSCLHTQYTNGIWKLTSANPDTGNVGDLCEFDDGKTPFLIQADDGKQGNLNSGLVAESLGTKMVTYDIRYEKSDSTSMATQVGDVTVTQQQHIPGVSTTVTTQSMNVQNIQPQSSSFTCNGDSVTSLQDLSANGLCDMQLPKTFDVTQPQTFPFPSFPTPSFSALSVQSEAWTRYLCNLPTQSLVPPGRVGTNGFAPLRPPPGLNTEPVPVGDPVEPPPSRSKLSSFDKLMEALQKKFPTRSRKDLIGYLKIAKTACGAAGFRGKQISEVVTSVEEVIRQAV